MVFFPGMGDGGIGQMLLSFVMLIVFFLFFPRIMLFQVTYKLKKSVNRLAEHAAETEKLFLQAVTRTGPTEADHRKMEPMKNMVFSAPTDIDNYGLVGKLENILDTSEGKMDRFVDDMTDRDLDDDERANLQMSFKGVYGTQQIYVLLRHFKELIEDTKNFQLGGMIQMMLPLYEEVAESQKEATRAFVNGVPIGDSVGPLIAAKFMHNDAEEVAEDVVVSEEEVGDTTVHVVKSNGPGSRLGKYGDAIEQIATDNDLDMMLFVDAGMRFEGEDTGTIVDGTGVMMGGPGVEKFKIEEVADDHDIPMEGFIIKQSGPQASRPMHSKIYEAVPDAVDRVEAAITDADAEEVLLVGVGNTVGVGNDPKSTSGIPNKLKPYWEEEEEESTSYFGLMKAFPMGGGDWFSGRMLPGTNLGTAQRPDGKNTFELFQSIVR